MDATSVVNSRATVNFRVAERRFEQKGTERGLCKHGCVFSKGTARNGGFSASKPNQAANYRRADLGDPSVAFGRVRGRWLVSCREGPSQARARALPQESNGQLLAFCFENLGQILIEILCGVINSDNVDFGFIQRTPLVGGTQRISVLKGEPPD